MRCPRLVHEADAGSGPTSGAASANDARSSPINGAKPNGNATTMSNSAGSAAGVTPGPKSTGGSHPVTHATPDPRRQRRNSSGRRPLCCDVHRRSAQSCQEIVMAAARMVRLRHTKLSMRKAIRWIYAAAVKLGRPSRKSPRPDEPGGGAARPFRRSLTTEGLDF
jgi:hypothetical protein